MRLSERNEGHISNYHRVIDGFLAGLPYDKLLPALAQVNVNPLEMPVVEIELLMRYGRPARTAHRAEFA